MATSRFNWAALLGIDEELKRRLEESFLTIIQNSNMSNQRHPMHGYMNNADQDRDEIGRINTTDDNYLDEKDDSNENSAQYTREYLLKEEIDKKRYTKKKLIKKQKICVENETSIIPVTKEKLNLEPKVVPLNSFYRPNKHQLQEAILWAEVLGEPKCRKRHRK